MVHKCHEFKIRVVDRSLRKTKLVLFHFKSVVLVIMPLNKCLYFMHLIRLPDDIAKVKLGDLRIVTTLGVGGFGRVELCMLAQDSSRAFALKKMKKCQVICHL